jgi:hypothetical protein
MQYEVRHSCYVDYPVTSPDQPTIACDVTSGDFSFRATDAGGAVIAVASMHKTPYGPGTTVTLPAWTAVTTPMVTVSSSGLSANVASLKFQVGAIVDGVEYQNVPQANPVISGGATSTTIAAPPGGDRLFAFEELNNSTAVGHKEAFQQLTGGTRAVTFTEPGLPWMGPLTWDAANQKVSWTTDGAGAYDGMILEALWSNGVTTTTYYDWTIIAPPGMTSISWANPPTQLAPYVPAVSDAPYSNFTALVDLSNASDYDALRQQPEWFLNNTGWSTEDGELPTGSSVALCEGAEGYLNY